MSLIGTGAAASPVSPATVKPVYDDGHADDARARVQSRLDQGFVALDHLADELEVFRRQHPTVKGPLVSPDLGDMRLGLWTLRAKLARSKPDANAALGSATEHFVGRIEQARRALARYDTAPAILADMRRLLGSLRDHEHASSVRSELSQADDVLWSAQAAFGRGQPEYVDLLENVGVRLANMPLQLTSRELIRAELERAALAILAALGLLGAAWRLRQRVHSGAQRRDAARQLGNAEVELRKMSTRLRYLLARANAATRGNPRLVDEAEKVIHDLALLVQERDLFAHRLERARRAPEGHVGFELRHNVPWRPLNKDGAGLLAPRRSLLDRRVNNALLMLGDPDPGDRPDKIEDHFALLAATAQGNADRALALCASLMHVSPGTREAVESAVASALAAAADAPRDQLIATANALHDLARRVAVDVEAHGKATEATRLAAHALEGAQPLPAFSVLRERLDAGRKRLDEGDFTGALELVERIPETVIRGWHVAADIDTITQLLASYAGERKDVEVDLGHASVLLVNGDVDGAKRVVEEVRGKMRKAAG